MGTLEGTDDQGSSEFRPPKHRRSLAGVLAGKAKRTFPTPDDLEVAIDAAWTIEVSEAVIGDSPNDRRPVIGCSPRHRDDHSA